MPRASRRAPLLVQESPSAATDSQAEARRGSKPLSRTGARGGVDRRARRSLRRLGGSLRTGRRLCGLSEAKQLGHPSDLGIGERRQGSDGLGHHRVNRRAHRSAPTSTGTAPSGNVRMSARGP
jgi:hypothetical protein